MRTQLPSRPPDRSPRRRVGLAAAIACLLLLPVERGRAGQNPTDVATRTLVLFDGKSLDGWKASDFYQPGEVKVQDGAIVLASGRPMTGVTSTRQDFPRTDYELAYEARKLSGGDFFAAATFPVGKSFLTFVNGGWGGGVIGLSSLNGADASENETNQSFKFRDKTWYRFRVRVTERVIRCWIDEKPVVAVAIEGRQVGTRTESNASKPLGFASYDTTGAIRNITIRTLTPSEVAEHDKISED